MGGFGHGDGRRVSFGANSESRSLFQNALFGTGLRDDWLGDCRAARDRASQRILEVSRRQSFQYSRRQPDIGARLDGSSSAPHVAFPNMRPRESLLTYSLQPTVYSL